MVSLLLHILQNLLTLIQCAFLSWSYKIPSLASTFCSYQTLHSSATIPNRSATNPSILQAPAIPQKHILPCLQTSGLAAPCAWDTLPHYLCWDRVCIQSLNLITSSEKQNSAAGLLHKHRLGGDLCSQN